MAKKIKSKGKESNSDDVTVFIGDKDELTYIRACIYVLKKSEVCGIKARYKRFMKAINVYFGLLELLPENGSTSIVSLWDTEFTDDEGRQRHSKEMMITVRKDWKVLKNGNGENGKIDSGGRKDENSTDGK
jgi:DNA-binding protein